MSGKWMRWVLRHDSGKWYRKQSLVPVKTFSMATTYPTKEATEKVTKVRIGYTPELVNVSESRCPHCGAKVLDTDYACPNCGQVVRWMRKPDEEEAPSGDEK